MVTGDKRTGPQKYGLVVAGITDKQIVFFGVFRWSDPNVIGTIETGSLICFQKGMYYFCSSNGLAVAGKNGQM